MGLMVQKGFKEQQDQQVFKVFKGFKEQQALKGFKV
jgi:hypothetical protein